MIANKVIKHEKKCIRSIWNQRHKNSVYCAPDAYKIVRRIIHWRIKLIKELRGKNEYFRQIKKNS